ncbi:MAG: hypothetical protein ACO1RX_20455 [Candidatus Sericytochromatia bacterium]
MKRTLIALLMTPALLLTVSCGPGPAGNNISSLSDDNILSIYVTAYQSSCPNEATVSGDGDKAAFCSCVVGELPKKLTGNSAVLADIRKNLSRDLKPGAPSDALKTLIAEAENTCQAAPAAQPSASSSQ